MIRFEIKQLLLNRWVLLWMFILLIVQSIFYIQWDQSFNVDGDLYKTYSQLTINELQKQEDSNTKNQVLKEKEHIQTYKAYILNILNSEENTVSIFQNSNSNRMKREIRSYYVGQNLKVGSNTYGSFSLQSLMEFPFFLLFSILMLFYCLLYKIQGEKDIGFDLYVRSLPKGSARYSLNQLISIISVLNLFVLLSLVTIGLITCIKYGFPDFLESAQTFMSCRSLYQPMPLYVFLLVYFVVEILTVDVLAMFFFSLSKLFFHVLIGLLIGISMLFGLHFISILPSDINNVLTFFDLSCLLDPIESYISLRHFALNNGTISACWIYLIVIVLIMMGMIISLLYSSNRVIKKSSMHLKFKQPRFFSMTKIEKFKLKGYNVTMLSILLILSCYLFSLPSMTTMEDSRINYFIDTIGQTYDQQKLLTYDSKYSESDDLEFIELKSSYDNYKFKIQEIKKYDKKELLKEDQYRYFFSNKSFRSVFLVLCVGSILTSVFLSSRKEEVSKMDQYYFSMPLSIQNILFIKWKIISIIGCLVCILINIFMMIKTFIMYPEIDLLKDIYSLLEIRVDYSISIFGYLLIQLFIQCLFICLLSFVLLVFFKSIKQKAFVYFMALFILVVPVILDQTHVLYNSIWLCLFYPFENSILCSFIFTLLITIVIVYIKRYKKEAYYEK